MDKRKPIAGLLAAGAFVTGVTSHEPLEIQLPQDQERFKEQPSPRTQFQLFGRTDHGPEEWPYAPVTLQGIVTMITTTGGSR